MLLYPVLNCIVAYKLFEFAFNAVIHHFKRLHFEQKPDKHMLIIVVIEIVVALNLQGYCTCIFHREWVLNSCEGFLGGVAQIFQHRGGKIQRINLIKENLLLKFITVEKNISHGWTVAEVVLNS